MPVRPYEGDDADAIMGEMATTSSTRAQARSYPEGLFGTAKAQMSGQLHGITGVAGAPADLAVATARGVEGLVTGRSRGSSAPGFVENYIEPFMPTSRWMRRVLDLPGHALGLEGNATYNDINEVPETYRPQARAGEAIGSAAPFVWGMGAAGRMMPAERALNAATDPYITPSVTRNIINSQIAHQSNALAPASGAAAQAAASYAPMSAALARSVGAPLRPFTTALAGQRGAALGAGAGAYGMEVFAPGSDAAQTIGQLGGGLLGALGTGAGSNALNRAMSRVNETVSTLTDEGSRNAIARSLAPQFERHGENVDDILSRLRTPEPIEGALPAEQSGSRVLMGVQNRLAESDPSLTNEITARNQQYRQNITGAVEEGFQPGDTNAVTAAARQQDEYLRNLVTRAEQEATQEAAGISGNAPQAREAINVRARDALERSLQEARDTENILWGRVPQEAIISPQETLRSYDAVRAQMLPSERLPRIVENEVRRLREEPQVPFRDIHRLRTVLINEARKARALEDNDLARRLNQIASGLPGEQGGALADMLSLADPNARAALERARTFSVLLNDRFSRTFAGDILGMSETGAPAVRPALTLEQTFAGKPAVQAQQARELRQAATPIGEGPPRPDMAEAQEQFLRTISQNVVDPQTGRVSPQRAATFLRSNAPALDEFPQYRTQIERAMAAELAAQQLSGQADSVTRRVLGTVLGGESPAKAIERIIGGQNPVREFSELARIARATPEGAAGLRASILSFISDKATGQSGEVSFQRINDLLTKPLMRGGPSILDMMQNNAIISPTQRTEILERIAIGARHETAPGQGVRIDSVGDEAGKVFRWGARILGAKMASFLGFTGGGAGPSLQVANIAASAAENALARTPVDKARQVISRAMQAQSPEELINILERISPSAGLKQRARQGELLAILRPLLPRTQSNPEIYDTSDSARRVLRDIRMGVR